MVASLAFILQQLSSMWRSKKEGLSEFDEVHGVLDLKRPFPDPMLLLVVKRAQTYGPAVGGFQSHPSVGPATNMGALDWQTRTIGH